MPVVPNDFVQTVMPQGAIAPQRVQATPDDFGAQVGQTLQRIGNEAGQQAILRQQSANETAANDTYATQFLPAFQKLYGDFYALQGKNAVDQRDSCLQSMEELRAGTRENLSNAAQQRMFDAMARRTIGMEQGAVIRYADQQNKLWQAQASDAAVQGFADITADKYNDPQRLQAGLTSIANEIARYGALAGQSDEVIRQRTNEAWDRLYKTIIERQAIDPDMGPEKANATFQDAVKTGLISGGAQLDIARYLKPAMDLSDAQRAYATATGGEIAPRIVSAASRAGVDPKTALSIASIESGLNPAAQNPASSAHGLFQHIDSTWAALGGTAENRNDVNAQIAIGINGLKADRDRLESDLGRGPQPWELYLAHQQGVKGAESLLNAAPDTRAASIVGEKAIVQNGGSADTTVGQFLDSTQQLVARKSMHFDDRGSPTAQNINDNYASGLDAMTALAEREHPGDPALAERYRNFYIQQTAQTLRAQQMAELANRETLRSGLAGENGAKTWSDFLADPGRTQAFADMVRVDPAVSSLVDRAISTNAMGSWDPPASDKTNDLRDELRGMQATDTTGFAALDLTKYYGDLPMHEWTDLLQAQKAIHNHDSSVAEKNSELVHALRVAQPDFIEASKLPGSAYRDAAPNSESPDATSAYNLYVGRFGRALDAWRQNNGGKIPNDADLKQIARGFLFPGDAGKTIAMANASPESRSGGQPDTAD